MPAIAEAPDFKTEDIPHVVLISERPELLAAHAQVTLAGFAVSTTGYSAGLTDILRRDRPPLTVVDLSQSEAVGLEVLETVQREQLGIAVIAVSRDGSLETAVKAMKLGAFDYLPEPFDSGRLISIMCKALGRPDPGVALDARRRPLDYVQGILSLSPAVREVWSAIEDTGTTETSVLVIGQKGIGRDVCARAIHARSRRRHQPYVTLNCAALPKALVEAELFGHVVGAFPGAVTERTALATEAHGGTLFIDEMCELDLETQRKILRLAQNGVFERLGSGKPAQVDLRIIGAMSREPALEVKEGRLLPELVEALHASSIRLPALRRQGNDIMLIARYFVDGKYPSESRALQQPAQDAGPQNRAYGRAGGARELQHALLDAITLNDDSPGDAARASKPAEQGWGGGTTEIAGLTAGSLPEGAGEPNRTPSNLHGLPKRKRSAKL